jgi:hypothetical protein
VDELLAKPNGFLHLLDKATKTCQGSDFILGECIKDGSHHVFLFSTDPHMPDCSVISGISIVYDLSLNVIVKAFVMFFPCKKNYTKFYLQQQSEKYA